MTTVPQSLIEIRDRIRALTNESGTSQPSREAAAQADLIDFLETIAKAIDDIEATLFRNDIR